MAGQVFKLLAPMASAVFIATCTCSANEVDSTFSEDLSDLDEKADTYSLSLGMGVGSLGFGFSGIITYDMGGEFLCLRAVRTDELKLFGPQPGNSISEFCVLYGWSASWEPWYMSIGAGIGYVRSVERGLLIRRATDLLAGDEYEDLGRGTIGVPLQIEISRAPFPFMGVAIVGFANINGAESFAGLTICLQFGKMR